MAVIRRSTKDVLSKMVLPIELIPSSSWYVNIRRNDVPAWKKIKAIMRKKHKTCVICGKKFNKTKWEQMDVHEVFSFDTATKTQSLCELQAICHACHMAKHPGYMSTLTTAEGKADYRFVVRHACKVNDISEEEFNERLRTAFSIWEDRSKIQWKVKVDEAYKFIEENQDLLA